MRTISFTVDPKVFALFPRYRRTIVVALGAENVAPKPDLSRSIETLVETLRATGNADDQRIVAWREAFGVLGMKVRDFRPSVDALMKRIVGGKPFGSINPIVDVGTIVSLGHVLPAGAHPLLSDSTEIDLKLASGVEQEVNQDGTTDAVPQGECILVDTGRVAARRWVWRQTHLSRITPETRDFFLNIDALPPLSDDDLKKAAVDAEALIATHFNVPTKTIILDATHPSVRVDI